MSMSWWRKPLPIKSDNLSWPRVLWVLVMAIGSGWLVGLFPGFLESQERGVYDILQARYGSFSPQYPLVSIVTSSSPDALASVSGASSTTKRAWLS